MYFLLVIQEVLKLVVVKPQHKRSVSIIKLKSRAYCNVVFLVWKYFASEHDMVGKQVVKWTSLEVLLEHFLSLCFFLHLLSLFYVTYVLVQQV